jgi:RNA ligase (TIGR02306 family)
MSNLIIEVCAVEDVLDHPNADRLEIVCIKGWKCIVQKGVYDLGDLVVYAPIDSLIPLALSDRLDVTKYLGKDGRVRTAKLRGVYSQGLIIPMECLPESKYGRWLPGDDVAEVLGIKKFEPQMTLRTGGQRIADHPAFHCYTSIENYNNFPDILKEGEMVVITEKIHGSNFRAINVGEMFMVGSHNQNRKEDPSDLYWRAARIYDIQNILPDGMEIFGEVYGRGIQKLHYDQNGISIVFFDIAVNGRFLNYEAFKEICMTHGLPMVPVIYEGPWFRGLLESAEGTSMIARHIREGIVIKPIYERYDSLLQGRVILKRISERYLLKDYGDDH